MAEAYRLTRKDGAPGIDGVTAKDYEANLESNLSDLLARIKSGRYVAPPVRRPPHPQGGRVDAAARHPDAGRQGGAAGDPPAAGADLRGGLPAVLVRLSAGTLGPRCPARSAHGVHGAGAPLGGGCRYIEILRHHRPRAPARLPRPASHGRRRPEDDRQMAEGRGARQGRPAPYDRRYAPGWCDLAAALEHLPAPRAGRMVRDCGAAAPAGALPAGPLRRRCGDGVRGPRGRHGDAGRAGQAARPVRAHAPSDQDPLRGFPVPAPARVPSDGSGNDVRLPRLHPRVGEIAQGQERRRPGDGQGPLRSGARVRERVAQAKPAPPVPGAARASVTGDPGTLRLLRHHRQRPADPVVSPPDRTGLEEMARAARPPQQPAVAALPSPCSRGTLCPRP